jgi:carbon monoxide dehydrogenase subunit G
MQLTNEFSVAAPVEEAWPLLTDIERIAPCVPGFRLTGVQDGEYRGTMKVKVGAVCTTYDCVIRLVDVDDDRHRTVIAARGKESRGQGGVTAHIVSTLVADGASTRASVITEVDVTGRVAQFGRGILADVSDRLVKQFVKQLETRLIAPEAAAEGPIEAASRATAPLAQAGAEIEDEPLNLLAVAGAPLAKRIAPLAALLLLALLVVAQRRIRTER